MSLACKSEDKQHLNVIANNMLDFFLIHACIHLKNEAQK